MNETTWRKNWETDFMSEKNAEILEDYLDNMEIKYETEYKHILKTNETATKFTLLNLTETEVDALGFVVELF